MMTTTEMETTTEALPPPETWPRGRFSLPMAGERCPEFESFRKGYFYQDTEDDHNANQWPRNTSMIGPMKSDGYRFNFCTKTSTKGEYRWEEGNYCLYQSSRKCPSTDFKQGSITWDDENSYNMNTRKGKVPFGKYTKDTTTVNFCCRDDGSAGKGIFLPVTRPFYMLRYKGACQKVRYMTVTEEVISWDDEDDQPSKNVNEGATPMDTGYGNNHALHFCLYQPIQI